MEPQGKAICSFKGGTLSAPRAPQAMAPGPLMPRKEEVDLPEGELPEPKSGLVWSQKCSFLGPASDMAWTAATWSPGGGRSWEYLLCL